MVLKLEQVHLFLYNQVKSNRILKNKSIFNYNNSENSEPNPSKPVKIEEKKEEEGEEEG